MTTNVFNCGLLFSPTCSGYSSLNICYFFMCFSFCWIQSFTLILFFLANSPPFFLPISPMIICIISTVLIIKYRPFSKDNTFLKKFFNCFRFFLPHSNSPLTYGQYHLAFTFRIIPFSSQKRIECVKLKNFLFCFI